MSCAPSVIRAILARSFPPIEWPPLPSSSPVFAKLIGVTRRAGAGALANKTLRSVAFGDVETPWTRAFVRRRQPAARGLHRPHHGARGGGKRRREDDALPPLAHQGRALHG